MKRNKSYITKDGIEVAVLPMEIWKETQGMFTGVSHKLRPAIDVIGTYGIKDDVLASWTMKIFDVRATEVFTINVNPVLFRGLNGKHYIVEPGTAITKLYHDNYVKDLKVGQIIKQGTPFYQEGTYGNVAMHVHIEVGIYKPKSSTEYLANKLSDGRYRVKGAVRLDEVYFSNDTDIQRTSYHWEEFPKELLKDDNEIVINGILDVPTIKALQKRCGTTEDGVISNPSSLVKEIQRRLISGEPI